MPFCSTDGKFTGATFSELASQMEAAVPAGHSFEHPSWVFSSVGGAGRSGWSYATDFASDIWYSEPMASSAVRRRIWFQVAYDPAIVDPKGTKPSPKS
jgi:hypothetical protein